MLFEDIDQAADRLITATETIQLVIWDIENNEYLTDVTSRWLRSGTWVINYKLQYTETTCQ